MPKTKDKSTDSGFIGSLQMEQKNGFENFSAQKLLWTDQSMFAHKNYSKLNRICFKRRKNVINFKLGTFSSKEPSVVLSCDQEMVLRTFYFINGHRTCCDKHKLPAPSFDHYWKQPIWISYFCEAGFDLVRSWSIDSNNVCALINAILFKRYQNKDGCTPVHHVWRRMWACQSTSYGLASEIVSQSFRD